MGIKPPLCTKQCWVTKAAFADRGAVSWPSCGGVRDAAEKLTFETYSRCEGEEQIPALDTSSRQPSGSVGRFRGRGELESRKVMGYFRTKVKATDATPITRPQWRCKLRPSANESLTAHRINAG